MPLCGFLLPQLPNDPILGVRQSSSVPPLSLSAVGTRFPRRLERGRASSVRDVSALGTLASLDVLNFDQHLLSLLVAHLQLEIFPTLVSLI